MFKKNCVVKFHLFSSSTRNKIKNKIQINYLFESKKLFHSIDMDAQFFMKRKQIQKKLNEKKLFGSYKKIYE